MLGQAARGFGRLRLVSTGRMLSASGPPRTYDRLRAPATKGPTEFSVDRAGLLGGGALDDKDLKGLMSNKYKEALSPLGKDLLSYIKVRGPITLHDYIAQTSNHAVHGYYQHAAEKIGVEGDFVTAPEISQLFGEMIGIWCLWTWQALGEPREVGLIELGPGKGTLMKDVLRVATKFPKFLAAINIHLVELSETMRSKQKATLDCQGDDQKRNDLITAEGVKVSWYHMLQQVPEREGVPSLVIGQEFLDAFPVHQFLYSKNGWRETLVDVDTSDSSPYFFRLVLSNNETPAVKALLTKGSGSKLEFSSSVPATSVSVNTSNVAPVRPLSNSVDDYRGHIPPELKEDDGIEICPLALATCEDIARRINKTRGAALLIDYGEKLTQRDSLRAFKKHQQVNILSEPGLADITADVDFSACSRVAARKGVLVYPVVGQGEFLQRLGIMHRVEKLIESESTTEEQATLMVESLRRLVGDKEMGTRFKVMAFSDWSLPQTMIGFPPPSASS